MTQVVRKKTSSRSAVKPKMKSSRTSAARSTARSARDPQLRTRRPTKAQAPSALGSIENLLEKLGDQFEPILYSLVCDDKHAMRSTLTNMLGKGSQAATLALVPMLVTQFALTPALAALVVGVVVKELVSKGPETLCAELAKAHAEYLRKQHTAAAKYTASTHAKRPIRRK